MSSEAYIGQRVKLTNVDYAKSTVFEPGEKLVCAIHGNVDKTKTGILFVTDKRVIFHYRGVLSGYKCLIFPYDQITAVNCISRFIIDKLELRVGSYDILLDSVPKGDGSVAAQIILDMRNYVSRSNAQPSQVDIADQIEKLGKLREKGLITEEDFVRKKDELLKRL